MVRTLHPVQIWPLTFQTGVQTSNARSLSSVLMRSRNTWIVLPNVDNSYYNYLCIGHFYLVTACANPTYIKVCKSIRGAHESNSKILSTYHEAPWTSFFACDLFNHTFWGALHRCPRSSLPDIKISMSALTECKIHTGMALTAHQSTITPTTLTAHCLTNECMNPWPRYKHNRSLHILTWNER